MEIILLLIFIYIVIGIYQVVFDFRLMFVDQPLYVHHPKLITILLTVIMWLPILIWKLKTFGLKYILKQRKKFRGRRKRAKEARMSRKIKPVDFFIKGKHYKALEEAVEEADRERNE